MFAFHFPTHQGQQLNIPVISVTEIFLSGQDQISGFQVFGQSTITGPEFPLYTDPGGVYGDGVYEIVLPQVEVATVIIRRDALITLCEVDVFGGKY